jgi:hypothetical protein
MAVRVHRCHSVSPGALAELRLENGRLNRTGFRGGLLA